MGRGGVLNEKSFPVPTGKRYTIGTHYKLKNNLSVDFSYSNMKYATHTLQYISMTETGNPLYEFTDSLKYSQIHMGVRIEF